MSNHIKTKCKCGKIAHWCYMPSGNVGWPYFCEDCVSRGCSCNHEFTPESIEGKIVGFGENPPSDSKNWKWLIEGSCWAFTDELGREFPCCEFSQDSNGWELDQEEIDFYKSKDIVIPHE